MKTIYFSAVSMVNALGDNLKEITQHLVSGKTGLVPENGGLLNNQMTWLGRVKSVLPPIPTRLAEHNSRNNQLLLATLNQIRSQVDLAIKRYGTSRIAIIMGTSTSGIDRGEYAIAQQQNNGHIPADFYYQQQELSDPSTFLAKLLGVNGPGYTISTACSSSARAIISGKRLIDAGLVDAALVGGADSCCQMTTNGFNSLASLSANWCQPFASKRDGINIGEAAALILLTKEPAKIALLGIGESSDAWHMSAPHPEGHGAEQSMKMALYSAGKTPLDIGYINLHGTATPLNDDMEAKAVNRLFGTSIPCSSTKHLTGHTLGAAGATEAAISWLILNDNLPLPCQNFSSSSRDKTLAEINLVTELLYLKSPTILSNSFAFGGNNASIILGEIK